MVIIEATTKRGKEVKIERNDSRPPQVGDKIAVGGAWRCRRSPVRSEQDRR